MAALRIVIVTIVYELFTTAPPPILAGPILSTQPQNHLVMCACVQLQMANQQYRYRSAVENPAPAVFTSLRSRPTIGSVQFIASFVRRNTKINIAYFATHLYIIIFFFVVLTEVKQNAIQEIFYWNIFSYTVCVFYMCRVSNSVYYIICSGQFFVSFSFLCCALCCIVQYSSKPSPTCVKSRIAKRQRHPKIWETAATKPNP